MLRWLLLAILPTLFVTIAPAADPADRSTLPIEEETTDAKLTKIVLIPGTPNNKPGEHEYFAGCAILRQLLAQTPGVHPVLVEKDWPKKASTLTGVKAIVFFSAGAGVQGSAKADHPVQVPKLADAGVGIVHLHGVIDYPSDFGERVRGWAGAVWEPKYSLRGHWVPTFDKFPEHPVTQGVTPFTIDDGWLYKLRFVGGMKGITPLLRTNSPKTPAKLTIGNEDIVAWTYDRPEGGRSFSFTGGHIHANLSKEGYRRFITNGILWSAGVEIPKTGAKVDLTTTDLAKYLDKK